MADENKLDSLSLDELEYTMLVDNPTNILVVDDEDVIRMVFDALLANSTYDVGFADSAEQALQRETVEQLYHAIHQLPKADAALVLLYLDDLSYREMAEVLGISESNVGVKLNRAKKALSALMNGQSHEAG